MKTNDDKFVIVPGSTYFGWKILKGSFKQKTRIPALVVHVRKPTCYNVGDYCDEYYSDAYKDLKIYDTLEALISDHFDLILSGGEKEIEKPT